MEVFFCVFQSATLKATRNMHGKSSGKNEQANLNRKNGDLPVRHFVSRKARNGAKLSLLFPLRHCALA
jgi:hypothetical protein